MKSKPLHLPRRQQGVVLVVSLVMLLVTTLIGVTAMQSTTLDEKMAGGMRDQKLAFQAAESALRSAELWLRDQTSEPLALATQGTNQVWTLNSPSATSPWWTDDAAWANAISLSGLPEVASQPKRIVEELRYVKDGSLNIGMPQDESGTMFYRVSTRGTGGTDTARAALQSAYAKRY